MEACSRKEVVRFSGLGNLTGKKQLCAGEAVSATMERANEFDVKLFNSSLDGDLKGVRAALVQGGNVAFRSPQGGTPLIAAAQKGHTDICDLLLAHGSDVNVMDPVTKATALHHATGRGHVAVVEALLSWRAAVDQQSRTGFTPLHAACHEGNLPCVLALLKAGASVTLPVRNGLIAIHIAAAENNVDVVRTLLEHGCHPDIVRYDDEIMCKNGKKGEISV